MAATPPKDFEETTKLNPALGAGAGAGANEILTKAPENNEVVANFSRPLFKPLDEGWKAPADYQPAAGFTPSFKSKLAAMQSGWEPARPQLPASERQWKLLETQADGRRIYGYESSIYDPCNFVPVAFSPAHEPPTRVFCWQGTLYFRHVEFPKNNNRHLDMKR